jgi:hypothetical protein
MRPHRGGAGGVRRGRRREVPEERAELGEHVAGPLGEGGALADERVAPPGERIVDRAGDGEHLPTLVGGEPRRDQRPALQAGLDDHHAEGEATDDAVAAREVRRQGWGAGRELGHQGAACRDPPREVAMARRVHPVGPGAQHSHGGPAGAQGAVVGLPVDAAREPARHAQPGGGELARHGARRPAPAVRWVPAAHHRDLRGRQDAGVTLDEERDRAAGQVGKQGGIARVVVRDQVPAGRGEPGEVEVHRRPVGRGQGARQRGGEPQFRVGAPADQRDRIHAGGAEAEVRRRPEAGCVQQGEEGAEDLRGRPWPPCAIHGGVLVRGFARDRRR